MSDLQTKILDATNGGLDIILEYYPQATKAKSFKIRDEKTASASLKQIEGGVYLVTDFGDDSKPRNAIHVCAKEEGMSFRDALLHLADRFQLLEKKVVLTPEIRKFKPTEVDYFDKFDEHNFYFEFNTELSEAELDTLGPLVTQEVVTRYRLFSVKFYAKKKESEIVQMTSTEHYPIFAFVNKTKEGKEWKKVLQPKAQDKKFRFFYVGGRPKDFVFGLDYVDKKFTGLQPAEELLDEEPETEQKETKLERIVIGSGDRDSLNLAGAGELVIWLNSETANFDTTLYSKLKSKAKKIINVPDIDKTGKIQGTELATQFMDIYTAWLPDYLSKSKDFRGNSKKDFLDFCNLYRHNTWKLKNEVRLLLDNAKPCQFWDVRTTKTGVNYEFNNVNAYYFLSLVGFNRMESPENRDNYIFILSENHLIHKINYLQVKDFVNNFLEEKQRALGERIIPNPLRNMIYNSNKMTENSLVNLPKLIPDFTDFGSKWQLLFFRNQVWRITKDGIINENIDKLYQNVWANDVIDEKVERTYGQQIDGRKIFIDSDYFQIFRDKEGDWNINILKNDCEFLNYLINTSRVHWQKEEYALTGESDEAREKYWNENKFNIAGNPLTEDEILEQKIHLINKIFIYGYIMHRYKDPAKPWAIYMMDNEVVSDDESHGGTGKSLMIDSFRVFMSMTSINARSNKLFDNQFVFDGVTEHTDLINFNDANKYFRLDYLYSPITSDLNVNPKNNQPYIIPFAKSPKFAISTNFSLRETSPSTMRRLLVGAFSDWYHYGDNQEKKSRTPVDDFGHRMFNDWKDSDWNSFFNFAAQSCKFFLSVNEKITAPDSNVQKRNSLAAMGVAFQNWADRYLVDFLNSTLEGDLYLNKREAEESVKSNERSLSGITAHSFVAKLRNWCIYNDVVLNPKEKITTKDGRIFKWSDGKSVEHYYLLRMTTGDDLTTGPEQNHELDGLDF